MDNFQKIRVFSRIQAEKFVPPNKYHAWISITTPGDEVSCITLRKPYDIGIKRVQFHDVDNEAWGSDYIVPDNQHAREIYSFMRWNYMAIEELYVHCDAGISRSAGVAAALSKIFLGSDEEFFKAPYQPNRLIYKLILQIHENQV